VTRTRRTARALLVLAAAAWGAFACTSQTGTAPPSPASDKGTIVVGVSGAFAENQLVAEMYALVLEDAGYTVERDTDIHSRESSQSALESGQVDVKPEYLSSLLLFVDPSATASNDPADVAAKVQAALAPKGIQLLKPSPAQDTNVFVANAQTADRYDLSTMSSLAPVAGKLTVGAPPECPQRPFCLTGLRDVYGITFWDFEPLDTGGPLTVEALRSDEIQIGLLFSTDPSIQVNGFVPLVDDLHLQNAENITPVIRTDALDDRVRATLDGVSAALTTDKVTTLVGEVTVNSEAVTDVARAFLVANDLL
jgi:osmoprotectant transport system substrate-binding protein